MCGIAFVCHSQAQLASSSEGICPTASHSFLPFCRSGNCSRDEDTCSSAGTTPESELLSLKYLIHRRGPDVIRTHTVKTPLGAELSTMAAVLGLRGVQPMPQPFMLPIHTSSSGSGAGEEAHMDSGSSFLLWNGEVFDGKCCPPPMDSDTALIAQLLKQVESRVEQDWSTLPLASRQERFLDEVRDRLEDDVVGAYSFVYYAASLSLVCWGRDPQGKRSLVLHTRLIPQVSRDPSSGTVELVVSSVCGYCRRSSRNNDEPEKAETLSDSMHVEKCGTKHARAVDLSGHTTLPIHRNKKEVEEENAVGAEGGGEKTMAATCWEEVDVSGLSGFSLAHHSTFLDDSPVGAPPAGRRLGVRVLRALWKSPDHRLHPFLRRRSSSRVPSSSAPLPLVSSSWSVILDELCTPAGDIISSLTTPAVKAVLRKAWERLNKACEDLRVFDWASTDTSTLDIKEERRKASSFASLVHTALEHHATYHFFIALLAAVYRRVCLATIHCGDESKSPESSPTPLGILFSGGLDCTVLAALAHYLLPPSVPIELINVAGGHAPWEAPDRIAAFHAMSELLQLSSLDASDAKDGAAPASPRREWRLVLVEIPERAELEEGEPPAVLSHVFHLVRPRRTVMDLDIGLALWFGAKGVGRMQKMLQQPHQAEESCTLHPPHKVYRVRGKGWEEQPLPTSDDSGTFAVLVQVMLTEYRLTGQRPDTAVRLSTLGKDYRDTLVPHYTSLGYRKLGPYLDAASRAGVIYFDPTAGKSSKGILLARPEDLLKAEEAFSSSASSPSAAAAAGQWYCTVPESNPPLPPPGTFALSYTTASRVLLLGSGADEVLGGYTRHRRQFKRGGITAAVDEMQKDFSRLWERNLGRDDRLVSDNAREARLPYLDDSLLACLATLVQTYRTVWCAVGEKWMERRQEGDRWTTESVEQRALAPIVDFIRDPGEGDKRVLRNVAGLIGLEDVMRLEKRAIQFGARVAVRKVHGSTLL